MVTRKRNIRAKKKSKKYKLQVGGGREELEKDVETQKILKFYNEFNDTPSITKLFTDIETYKDSIQPVPINSSPVDASGKKGLSDVKVLTDVDDVNKHKTIYHNSSLLVCGAHGSIKDKYITVPNNTIICFVSSMPYIDNIQEELFLEYMNSITYPEFKQLLKYRTYNRNINLNSTNNFNNCIKNSIWYYPGQLVPDTMQCFKEKEFHTERKYYYEITFWKERIRKHNKFKEDLFIQLFEKEQLKFVNGIYDFYLSDLLKKLPPRPGGFRLLMFTSCRCFQSTVSFEKQKQMIELEFYYSRLNAINDLKILKSKPPVNKLNFRCNHCRLNSYNEFYIEETNKLEEIRFDNELKRYCYHTHTQHLVKMAEDFCKVKSPKKINQFDLRYIGDLSTMKILKFFTSQGFEGVEKEQMGKILAEFINCAPLGEFRKIKYTLHFFFKKLHLIDLTNLDKYKHYIGGIMQLLKLFNQNQQDVRLDLIRDLQNFVNECQKDSLLNYFVTQELPPDYYYKKNIINKLDDIVDSHLAVRLLTFNFDVLGELKLAVNAGKVKKTDKLFNFHQFKGLRIPRDIIITNIENDGEIDNFDIKSVSLKSTKPEIKYKLNCHTLMHLSIEGLQFNTCFQLNLHSLSLTKTNLNSRFMENLFLFCEYCLEELYLTDVNLIEIDCDKFFQLVSSFKNLRELKICALTVDGQIPQNIVIPPDLVKNMKRLYGMHLSGMPNMKLDYIQFILYINSNAIDSIELEINGIENIEKIGTNSEPFVSFDPIYREQYNKLKESNYSNI